MSSISSALPRDVSTFLDSKVEHLTAELEQISDIIVGSYSTTDASPILHTDCKTRSALVFRSKLMKTTMLALVVSGIVIALLATPSSRLSTTHGMQTQFIIENLRGDTIDTWRAWKWIPDSVMGVGIVNEANLDDSKIDVVKNAILSEEKITIDNSIAHKGPKGTSSIYYEGWVGALGGIKQATKYTPPELFNIVLSDRDEGRIVILLTNDINTDGYTGYTKSTVSGNEILKSYITIYGADSLSDEQLATIVRHEFGHALGLGHSTAPEDLMAPTIATTIPYISECNIEALQSLYDGYSGGSVICQS